MNIRDKIVGIVLLIFFLGIMLAISLLKDIGGIISFVVSVLVCLSGIAIGFYIIIRKEPLTFDGEPLFGLRIFYRPIVCGAFFIIFALFMLTILFYAAIKIPGALK